MSSSIIRLTSLDYSSFHSAGLSVSILASASSSASQTQKSLENKYVLKAVSASSDETVYAIGSTVVLDMADVAALTVKSIRLEATGGSSSSKQAQAASNDVRTDVEISAAAAAGGGAGNKAGSRQLEQASSAWTSASNSRADMLLEDGGTGGGGGGGGGGNRNKTAPLKGSIDGWDQFKANEKLFNVKGSYDENLYTTALDKTQMTSRKIKEAERITREIETSVSTNMHVAEERGQTVEGDYDEEDLYSGVLKPKDPAASAGGGITAKAQKVMNYAAAAAAKKDTVPPGFNKTVPAASAAAIKPNKANANGKATEEKVPAAKDEPKATTTDTSKVEETATGPGEESKKEEEAKKAEAPKSKLSASAKSFSLSIKAKEWTPPTVGAPPPAPPGGDPSMAGRHPMSHSQPPPHYLQQGMGQPGMTHMMNPQYQQAGRYQGYAGMEQQMQPQHHMQQPQVPQQQPVSETTSGEATPIIASASEEDLAAQQQTTSVDGDSSSQQSGVPSGQQSQQQPQYPMPPQQQMQMQYGMPPQGNYYGGQQMPMHPSQQRGPAGPHPGYHPGRSHVHSDSCPVLSFRMLWFLGGRRKIC